MTKTIMAGVYVPSFRMKALMVLLVGGIILELFHPIVCLVWQAWSDKAGFFFFNKERLLFLSSFKRSPN